MHGNRIKALVFTSPNNPLGKVCTKHDIQNVFKWCVDHDIYFIAYELFVLCKMHDSAQFILCMDCVYNTDCYDKYLHFISEMPGFLSYCE